MKYTERICSFTGYRLQKLYESFNDNNNEHNMDDLKSILTSEIDELISGDYLIFQCGMALGSDMLFADVVLGFRKQYPRVKFNAIIPCREQEKSWAWEQQEEYNRLLESASKIELVSDSPYFNGCMQLRNRRLVDTCDILLAVFDGKRGGTSQTVEYAKKQGKLIHVIDPAEMCRVTLIQQGRLT